MTKRNPLIVKPSLCIADLVAKIFLCWKFWSLCSMEKKVKSVSIRTINWRVKQFTYNIIQSYNALLFQTNPSFEFLYRMANDRIELKMLFDSDAAQKAYIVGLTLGGCSAKNISEIYKISDGTVAKWKKTFLNGKKEKKRKSSDALGEMDANAAQHEPSAEKMDALDKIKYYHKRNSVLG